MKTNTGYCVEKGWLPYKKKPMRKPYGIVSAKWGIPGCSTEWAGFSAYPNPVNLQSSLRQIQIAITYHTN
jgi:hypothetical protein